VHSRKRLYLGGFGRREPWWRWELVRQSKEQERYPPNLHRGGPDFYPSATTPRSVISPVYVFSIAMTNCIMCVGRNAPRYSRAQYPPARPFALLRNFAKFYTSLPSPSTDLMCVCRKLTSCPG
jgi:hypothetical protein